ncbi:(4Fe-4S)-binding protein [Flavobacterium agricola]|uniref:(4Fe-4S)-binding protein n=1 Tax=Flavobacterium agricola TaxID=2870839 RepID=A0ABY6M282_9FLAO|nr:(4Fe-4S)-binding protein [Flavobacterium agricola]UYW01887.1 (4Fe-4S)-binding protein [Flavobacterium agricola]
MKEHEYSNGEITVIWKPDVCQHSAVCLNLLPQVYNPGKRPWINLGDTPSELLRAQINACPSSALSYIENKEI